MKDEEFERMRRQDDKAYNNLVRQIERTWGQIEGVTQGVAPTDQFPTLIAVALLSLRRDLQRMSRDMDLILSANRAALKDSAETRNRTRGTTEW